MRLKPFWVRAKSVANVRSAASHDKPTKSNVRPPSARISNRALLFLILFLFTGLSTGTITFLFLPPASEQTARVYGREQLMPLQLNCCTGLLGKQITETQRSESGLLAKADG